MNNDNRSISALAGTRLSRRDLLKLAGAGLLLLAAPGCVSRGASAAKANVVLRWNDALLDAIRTAKTPPPIAARALAITHTAMYDAWTAYTERARPTRPGFRRPKIERTLSNKSEAISHAARKVLVEHFPDEKASFDALMRSLGYDPSRTFAYGPSPAGIGNRAAKLVLDARRGDGSNQENGYADTTGYRPVNAVMDPSRPFAPTDGFDPDHWQPLLVSDGHGGLAAQEFLAPHWGGVRPFGLSSGGELRGVLDGTLRRYKGGGRSRYVEQFGEALGISAGLDDRRKTIAEYWADGPGSATPPGHWNDISHYVSQRDRHTLDEDVKLYFALNNALMDAGIASWDCKLHYDSIRPIGGIRFLNANRRVRAWAGPGKGARTIDGATWLPYQKADSVTPPFPEFVSGHSTFSRAASVVLEAFTGSDRYGGFHTQEAGASLIEPGIVPASPVTLSWKTFTEAAEEAGMSRLYGGIHIMDGNTGGMKLGEEVGKRAWSKARSYFDGA